MTTKNITKILDFCRDKKIYCRIDSNNTRNTFCSHWMYVYGKSNYGKNWFCNDWLYLTLPQVVCEEVENEYVLSSLKCNIHPLMMMQCKGKQLFQVIHDKIENNEINKCFTSILISKVNLFHLKPLDVSHPPLIETFLQNRGIDKNIWCLYPSKKMNLFH